MGINYSINKGIRLLKMYEMLQRGEHISKQQLMNYFHVTAKTVQRDIDDLRAYFAEVEYLAAEDIISYSRSKGGYSLSKTRLEWMKSSEVLAVCKILLASNGLSRNDLITVIDKLLLQVNPLESKQVKELLLNEKEQYAMQYSQSLLEYIWILSKYIVQGSIVYIKYEVASGGVKRFRIKPISIQFSESHFCLIALSDVEEEEPVIFRLEQIKEMKDTGERFQIPYKEMKLAKYKKQIQTID